jgi:hypothetical protein
VVVVMNKYKMSPEKYKELRNVSISNIDQRDDVRHIVKRKDDRFKFDLYQGKNNEFKELESNEEKEYSIVDKLIANVLMFPPNRAVKRYLFWTLILAFLGNMFLF